MIYGINAWEKYHTKRKTGFVQLPKEVESLVLFGKEKV